MTRNRKFIVCSLLVSCAVLLLVAGVLFFKWQNLISPDERQVDIGPLRKTTTTSCTTRPISLAEAQRLFTFPFPKSASNIQFAHYHEFLANETFLRFEAPIADCIEAVPAILDSEEFAKITKLSDESRALRPISRVMPPHTSPLVIPWFNPEQIQTGLETGFAGSYQPKVWIDTKRGIFYYQLSD